MKIPILPLERSRVKLIVRSRAITIVLREILTSTCVFGFDTEWKPEFTRGTFRQIDLLQIATTRHVFLIKTQNFNKSHWKLLRAIFENERILKIGFSLQDDLRRITQGSKWRIRGHLDIQRIVGNQGLKSSTEKLLGYTLNKSRSLTMHNWEETLEEQHILYAARDAVAPLYLALSIWEQTHIGMPQDNELACFLNLLAVRMRTQRVSPLQALEVAPTLLGRLAKPEVTVKAKPKPRPKRKTPRPITRAKEVKEPSTKTYLGDVLSKALKERGLNSEGSA